MVARLVHAGPVLVKWVSAPLPDALRRHEGLISRRWTEAVATHPGTLFDDMVLACLGVAAGHQMTAIEVTGQFVPYRCFFVQQHSANDLDLGLTAVAVSGLVLLTEVTEKFVVFGRRSSDVSAYPGRIELVPSGGITPQRASAGGRVDYAAQIMQELEEEACVPADWVEAVDGFAVVIDEADHTCDIACRITLRPDVDRRAFAECFSRSAEYAPEPLFVPFAELEAFVRAHAEEMVPASRVLVDAFGGRRCT